MRDYGPPVDRFLDRPDEPSFGYDWPDYLALGLGSEHIPDLIRMATDPELNEGDSEGPEVWAPVHAWRTLGQLRAEAAVGPLTEMLADLSDDWGDDWANEELPIVLGMIGPAALPSAGAILEDESAGDHVKTAAGQVLEEAGKRHPESRDECVALLARALERASSNEPFVNGFLISNLLSLHATEAAGVIERAFAGGYVDDSIVGTWYEVWHDLGLEGEPPPRTERQYRLVREFEDDWIDEAPFEDDWIDELPPEPTERPSWVPAVTRSPEQRKERNKARKKLEQKVKGKKGKKR